MALNIEDIEVETLASEVAALTHESETEAIKQALLLRRVQIQANAEKHPGRKNLKEFMEKEIWHLIPAGMLGRSPLTREEEDEILGYGPEGY